MNQPTATLDSGEASERAGGGSETLNLSSPPGEIELKVSTRCPGTETNSIKQLLNEFKALYEQRLRCLELDTTLTRQEMLQVSRPDFL